MPTRSLRPKLYSGPHWGNLQRSSDPLAGKGEGPPEGGPLEKRGGGREGEGRGKEKIVATRCQILRLKCEDALYKKCTD